MEPNEEEDLARIVAAGLVANLSAAAFNGSMAIAGVTASLDLAKAIKEFIDKRFPEPE